jgi:predicted transcriptional regulator of viral defense system
MSIQSTIQNRLRRRGRGTVFSASDFADLGTRRAITQALVRLTRSGMIRRIDRGFYDFPAKSARVGFRSPDPDQVAQAAARRAGHQIQASGAVAAHALGLSDQVPARAVYYTSGPSRTIAAGNRTVALRNSGPRALMGAGTISGDVYQALLFLGRDEIDEQVINHLRSRLHPKDKRRILTQLTSYPSWVQDVLRRVAQG